MSNLISSGEPLLHRGTPRSELLAGRSEARSLNVGSWVQAASGVQLELDLFICHLDLADKEGQVLLGKKAPSVGAGTGSVVP